MTTEELDELERILALPTDIRQAWLLSADEYATMARLIALRELATGAELNEVALRAALNQLERVAFRLYDEWWRANIDHNAPCPLMEELMTAQATAYQLLARELLNPVLPGGGQ